MADQDETSDQHGISRRTVVKGAVVVGAAAWAAPAITTLGDRAAAGSAPPGGAAALTVQKAGPGAAFEGQTFDFTVTVMNIGTSTATNVVVTDTLPGNATFVSSVPAAVPAAGVLTVPLGSISSGGSATVTITMTAPNQETTVDNSVVATADNAAEAGPASASVIVSTKPVVTGQNVTGAGVGLRNRPDGTIVIAGVPGAATVKRAVLAWQALWTGAEPANTITFNGNDVTADVATTSSGTLCWNDSGTTGYAADVTAFVTGNGSYVVTNFPQGAPFTVDSDPTIGNLPATDGASLFVFYEDATSKTFEDYTYQANTAGTVTRTFSGITPSGAGATCWLSAADGQNNGSDAPTFTGSSTITMSQLLVGTDPIDPPTFPIGSLHDTPGVDVSSVMPSGQSTFTFELTPGGDCIGIGAVILQVAV